MLLTNDIGVLFASLQAAYGHKFAHQVDAIPIWQNALRHHSVKEIMRGANKAVFEYPDFPPTLGQFVRLVDEAAPRLPDPNSDTSTLTAHVYAYSRPHSSRNPQGNPHKITLPESIARRQMDESEQAYERRISDAVTLALYPNIAHQFQRER